MSTLPPALVPPRRPDATQRLAVAELRRFLHLLYGRPPRQVSGRPPRGRFVRLETGSPSDAPGPEGYRLETRGAAGIAIAARTSVGHLYGVYGLLERLGVGFYAGGPALPDPGAPPAWPRGLDETRRPVFSARGNMLHYNFLCGCTDWGPDDWRFYFDQLARMRCNTLLMHWYDHEPGAACELDGEVLGGNRTPNSLSLPWGARAALRTSEFAFGSGRWFDAELFSSPAGADLPDALTEIRRSEAAWREAVAYARAAGVRVAAGFEAPHGSPNDPAQRRAFDARLEQFLARNPDLAFFALWQHEGGSIVGAPPPEPGTADAALLERHRSLFAHLGAGPRVWEAVRYGAWAARAAERLERLRPDLRLVAVGWGGDRWMRFAELCPGYDRWLPSSVVFTCHDNIDADFGPGVSAAWGELPPERERWAMPWVEGDIDECWVRQPHVETLGRLAPDALRKGAQGLLTLQWRTRDVEEETGYAARFAWDPALTPRRFCRDLARHAFGPDHEDDLGRRLGALQRAGARWTGVRGSVECGDMVWTGHAPHYPFDLDGAAAAYLAPLAERAADALAVVPPRRGAGSSGAYHLRREADGTEERDPSRLGVAEFTAFAGRLRALAGEEDEARLRAALRGLFEEGHALRAELIAYGMFGASFRGVDDYLLALHHLVRNAGASRKIPRLRAHRRALARLRDGFVREGRVDRLERLDHLAATMDFVLRYDAVAMRFADGEAVPRAVEAAEAARARGAPGEAASIAAAAYRDAVGAGMAEAVRALERKLTTRCDFGVLATFNVKALPLYREDLAKLEAFFPAVPPFEVVARGLEGEALLSWRCSGRAAGYHVYRRPAAGGAWRRVSRRPVAPGGRWREDRMFIDRPARPAAYLYAVTAVDAEGWESPRCHAAPCDTTAKGAGPRIVAVLPPSRAPAGRDVVVRVAVRGDREPLAVRLAYRRAGASRWTRVPMLPAFRDTFTAALPGAALRRGTLLEWFVEAEDASGARVAWPAAAAVGRPWILAVAA